jgi:hypothetical protein
MAADTELELQAARAKIGGKEFPELLGTDLDLSVSALLARSHAEKMQAATHLAFFELTKEPGRLPEALKHSQAALNAWNAIVERTSKAYYHNLSFGIEKGNHRTRGDHRHDGTWKDRLPEFQDDIATLKSLLAKHGGIGQVYRPFPGEREDRPSVKVDHDRVEQLQAGIDLPIDLAVISKAPVQSVVVYFRPLDQTRDWKTLPLRQDAKGRWTGTIPGNEVLAKWDFQYYFAIRDETGQGRTWPAWEEGSPYVVARVGDPSKVKP